MRTRMFVVPKDKIATFFDHVDDSGLETRLSEITGEEELVVDVSYTEDERGDVMNLIELIDEEFEEEPEEEKPQRKKRK